MSRPVIATAPRGSTRPRRIHGDDDRVVQDQVDLLRPLESGERQEPPRATRSVGNRMSCTILSVYRPVGPSHRLIGLSVETDGR